MSKSERKTLTNIVDDVADTAQSIADDTAQATTDGTPIELDTLVNVASRHGGLIPIMTVVALVIASPLSGIPLMSSICGIIIALCAVQAALGRRTLWLPEILKRRRVDSHRVVGALHQVRKVAHWLENRASRRLPWLSAPPVSTVFLGLAAIYGLCMPALEFVPFSSSVMGIAIVLIGLGLLLRDGFLLLISTLPPIAVGFLVSSVLSA